MSPAAATPGCLLQGQLVRLSLDDIKIQRRTTKGVRVIKLSEGDEVSSATVLRTAGGK